MWMIKWQRYGFEEPIHQVVGEPHSLTWVAMMLEEAEDVRWYEEISLTDGKVISRFDR